MPSAPEGVAAGFVHFLERYQRFLLDSDCFDLFRLSECFLEALAHRLKALQYVLFVRRG